FDHAQILEDYVRFRETGQRPRPAPPRASGLDPADSKALLRIARHAIEDALAGRSMRHDPAESRPALIRKSGCFVTLRTMDGELRGCIGDLSGERPLVDSIRTSAISAALRDPRFLPVTQSELPALRIALSVLTPIRAARADEVEVGRHGLLIERGPMRGVLLPEVAVEQGWNREQFLAGTCRKAGLPLDAWRAPGTSIGVFETLKIAE
ncbi:MAG: AmmeMemoRadiSam system protein A, partial [Sandaracinaceae bacterium]|nr:AmmeMemoRadiSam system protein A [Sandaracinaceae bacterium]